MVADNPNFQIPPLRKEEEEGKKKEPCTPCKLRITEAEEKYLRAYADLENYKKRQQKEMDMYRKTTLQSIVLDFLPIIDEINMAISTMSKTAAKGLELSRDNLLKRLEKHGIKPIDVGNKFDPNFHDAILTMEKESCKKGVVLMVIEEGYMLGGFLLKPAKVVVSE